MKRALVLVAAGAAVLASACSKSHASAKAPTPVRVVEAAPLSEGGGLRYSATIQPRDQVSLAFKSGGYVREIRRVPGADGRPRALQQGDVVAAGTVLARVRDVEYAQKVAEARAALAEAEASAERAKLDFERAETLYASASMTKPEWEAAKASQRAGIARAAAVSAQLDAAQTALDDTALTTPIRGILLSRAISEGSLVSAGTVGFVVADVSSVKAVFGVPDRVVAGLKLGDRLTVTTEAAPGQPFPGVLTALSPSADPKSRVFDVEVTIDNRDGRLRSGLIAAIEVGTAAIAATVASGRLGIPLTAVIQSPRAPDAYAVFVVSGDGDAARARSREVKLGQITGNHVAVLEGLQAGDRVVVSGASLLTEDEAVRIVP
jgi:multidrug efflux system membrane fusion protein